MIVLSPDAVLDIERLRDFLAPVNPEAAQRALSAIWSAVERLQEFPAMGTADSGRRHPANRDSLRTSGYIVRYAMVPGSGDILITRIWHGRETRT